MFYNQKMPRLAAKHVHKERRIKLTEKQISSLEELSSRIDVPISALVRMAVDCFLPKMGNSALTEKGIKIGHIQNNY